MNMTHYKSYPFTAIVGQDLMKLALILNAINPHIGGVLIKGAKGTAKSTAVRALADLLPEIRSIKDCPFNCNPDDLKEACHACQHKILDHHLEASDIQMRNMRVINLPINATEDRVVGTVNIEKALTQGLRALEPGILAEAHRNILYIDEVNLLADNVADILLDAAAMGINIIEREGISLHHPAKFILVGTMNPEEGHLRPQLLDRFGLSVEAEQIQNIAQRVEIIKNLEAYQVDPADFHDRFEERQKKLRKRIIQARELLPKITISEELLNKIAQIGIEFQTEGHRADIAILITAKTIAAYEGREAVCLEDIRLAAKLALPHRMRKLPFQDDRLDENKLNKTLQTDDSSQNGVNESDSESISNPKNSNEKVCDTETTNIHEKQFGIKEEVHTDTLLTRTRTRDEMNATGNLVSHPTNGHRGKYIGTKKTGQLNIPKQADIAILPTINSASLEPDNRNAIAKGDSIKVKEENIHLKARIGKSSYLIIFALDASGSMGVQDRMELAKGAVFSLLQKNYVNRDKVSVVVFRQDHAEIVLPPTRSIDLAYRLLKEIPTGGTTPLAAGLLKAISVADEEHRKDTGYIPLIILISDAHGNVCINDISEDLEKIATEIKKKQISMIVIDTEQSAVKLGVAQQLASAAKAVYYHIDQLTLDGIEHIFYNEGILNAESHKH
jgi:magnesium chelatase subunit D